jgi:hypothetical protein
MRSWQTRACNEATGLAPLAICAAAATTKYYGDWNPWSALYDPQVASNPAADLPYFPDTHYLLCLQLITAYLPAMIRAFSPFLRANDGNCSAGTQGRVTSHCSEPVPSSSCCDTDQCVTDTVGLYTGREVKRCPRSLSGPRASPKRPESARTRRGLLFERFLRSKGSCL